MDYCNISMGQCKARPWAMYSGPLDRALTFIMSHGDYRCAQWIHCRRSAWTMDSCNHPMVQTSQFPWDIPPIPWSLFPSSWGSVNWYGMNSGNRPATQECPVGCPMLSMLLLSYVPWHFSVVPWECDCYTLSVSQR
jgi:hypothetical protein